MFRLALACSLSALLAACVDADGRRQLAGVLPGGLGLPIFWAVSNGTFAVARDELCSHRDVIGVGRSNRRDL